MIRLRNGSRIVIKAIRDCSRKRLFSSVRKHDPYYELKENHLSIDYRNLFSRLASNTIFESDGSPLVYSSALNHNLLSIGEYEEFMKKEVFMLLGVNDMSIPFVSTSGCISNYRTILDAMFLSGLSRSVIIPRPSDNRLKECIFRSKISYDEYRYLNYRSGGLNFGGMLEDFYLNSYHSCFFVDLGIQYPTGCIIRDNHWRELLDCCKQHHLLLWLNLQNGGLGEKSLQEDLQPVRECIQNEIGCILSIDFSGSLGLQRNGIGCVVAFVDKVDPSLLYSGFQSSVYCLDRFYSLFSEDDSRLRWEATCKNQRLRFKTIRNELVKSQPDGVLSFVQNQVGPFSTIPLSRTVLKKKNDQLGIKMREDGFINLSGMQEEEIKSVSKLLVTLQQRR